MEGLADGRACMLRTPCNSLYISYNLYARRSLYRHLVRMEQAVGSWRSVGDGPEGTLLHVGWRRDHLDAVHLVCNTAQLDPRPR